MKGFKNMKKIVAVLVLALVAMTAVFAATPTPATGDGDLKVTLSVAGYTRFGFTDGAVANTDTQITPAADKSVANKTDANNTIEFYASVITTNQDGATVTLTLPTKLVNTDDKGITDTIEIKYVEKPEAEYSIEGAKTIVRDSRKIKLYVENYDNKTSGNYEAIFKMTVEAL